MSCASRSGNSARTGEPWIKKAVAATGYKVINKIADVSIPPNTGDFRLMSRRVVDELVKLKESHGFLRGMVRLWITTLRKEK